ncbi:MULTISPECIES: helix-turn-helix domain-containing protein [Sphingobacterium]|uniref:Helix-turn-helix domain-containing protein n=1 Tax=Sphingobacterium populi TaxID=1812824 RepID=A0ABW5U795_9SPHI|nr:AraC family transcriptional regulator [Sphingobacterium sp. CFCC 11742]
MKEKKNKFKHQYFHTLSDVMEYARLPKPQHPLVTVLNGIDKPLVGTVPSKSHVLSFYKIVYKPQAGGSMQYGQTKFDFQEGGMFFASPQQLISSLKDQPESERDMPEPKLLPPQIILLIDPDYLAGYPLAKKISKYHFFSYSVRESLHLSVKEKELVLSLFRNIEEELSSRIDTSSQDVVISQIELLLTYAQRFYNRQFLTRKPVHHTLVDRLNSILNEYFDQPDLAEKGLPTVSLLADALHMTPNYLSDLLKSLTGSSTQQYIHDRIIHLAKDKLLTTNKTISEISYELGFEHSQSFSKLFKKKTSQRPSEYRLGFN